MALNQQLAERVNQLKQKTEEATAIVNEVLEIASRHSMWHWLVPIIRSGMNNVAQSAGQFFTDIAEVITKPGSETALLEAGKSWHTGVAMPANKLAGDLNLAKLGGDDYWTGLAGDAYQKAVQPHSGAFNDLRIVADGLQNSLTSMANEVRAFFWAVIGAAASALAGVVGLAAVVVPPATPVALGVAAAAFSTAVGLLTAAIATLVAFMNNARSQQTTLQQSLDRITAWPPADTALADKGDWKVKPTI